MSNIKYDGTKTDDVLGVLDQANTERDVFEGTKHSIQRKEAEIERQHPDRGWYNADGTPMSPEEYKQKIAKDMGIPKGSKRKSNRRKQKILAVVAALITACTIFITKHINTPKVENDITETITETSNFNSQLRILSDFAIQKGILKQEEGLFKSPKLNIPIEDFIEFANIDSNDHVKIYLWSRLGIPVSDILKGISLRNTNMYFDSPEIENTYYASVINEFGETIKNETPLGVQYSKLMEKTINGKPKDERDNLIANAILDYIIEQEANTKGGNYGR